MDVPLQVRSKVKGKKEYFEIWYNGKQKIVNAPIKPFFYTRKELPILGAKREYVDAIALSDFNKKNFFKYSFNTRYQLSNQRNADTYEDNVPFVIRNRLENPDVFREYKQKDLTFLFLDIEQETSEGLLFPTFDDRITSIAWATNDREVHVIGLKKDAKDDKELIKMFLKDYAKISPDVIVVYNKDYDIATLLKRCERLHINTNVFSKNVDKPMVGGRDGYFIPGVVIYDVFQSAYLDQSLTGDVDNRGLKEVSNHFGFKETRPPLTPEEMNKYIGTKTLLEYNRDDVLRLMLVFDAYWTNIEYNANDLGIPLNYAISLTTMDLGLLMMGDEYKRLNVIADGSNEQRYPEIFNGKKGPQYRGAIIDIHKTGRFDNVYKADFSSMYPTIMATFNLSPDTTTLLALEEYQDEFLIEEHDDHFIYYIPDDIINATVIIKVLKKPGFAAALVSKLLKERSVFKQRYKKEKHKIDKAKSDNRKVKANGGVYGIQGSSKHAFGFAPIAIATTGFGRQAITILINLLNDLYPKSVIEIDTDGIYFNCDPDKLDKELIKNELAKRLHNFFNKPVDLAIDFDDYKAGYFYRAKNYVLLTKDDRIIYHGVVMKARTKNTLCKELIKRLAHATLFKEDVKPIIFDYTLMQFPLEWFAMNVRMSKPRSKYKSRNCITLNIARQALEAFKMKPEEGNIYHYVKEQDGYKLFNLSNLSNVDMKYYKNQTKKIFDVFGVDLKNE